MLNKNSLGIKSVRPIRRSMHGIVTMPRVRNVRKVREERIQHAQQVVGYLASDIRPL